MNNFLIIDKKKYKEWLKRKKKYKKIWVVKKEEVDKRKEKYIVVEI